MPWKYFSVCSLLRLVLSGLVIKGITYEDILGTVTDLEVAHFGLSDGECLLCADTRDTRVINTSSCPQNLADVSVCIF